MKIDATTYQKLPEHLKALFQQAPNPSREEVVSLFPETAGQQGKVIGVEPSTPAKNVYGEYGRIAFDKRGDKGSASRFFYCAKASKRDRGEGNSHPTVKPIDLMRYLCRLVTPPGGIVLDPFLGSGTTALAATMEGFKYIGCELNTEYIEIARRRLSNTQRGLPLL